MGFIKKTWKNLVAEYPNRRVLTDTTNGTTQTVTVTRSVGTVSQEGDAWDASNMNDMEDRIEDAFDGVDTQLNGFTLVELTQAEYDSMGSHDANTLYFIEE